jgi:hypothetical protein
MYDKFSQVTAQTSNADQQRRLADADWQTQAGRRRLANMVEQRGKTRG